MPSGEGIVSEHFHTEFNDVSRLKHLLNFSPDLTIFYRPEILPFELVSRVPGKRVGFYTEPLPANGGGRFRSRASQELRVRKKAYSFMRPEAYHELVLFDTIYRESAEKLKLGVTSFSPIPVNTEIFRDLGLDRDIDVCFVGKATPHRIRLFDRLRSSKFKFVWVGHGFSAMETSALFSRSKVVLNAHADSDVVGYEPRIDLGLASGALVLSEPIVTGRRIHSMIFQTPEFSDDVIELAIREATSRRGGESDPPFVNPNMILDSFLTGTSAHSSFFVAE